MFDFIHLSPASPSFTNYTKFRLLFSCIYKYIHIYVYIPNFFGGVSLPGDPVHPPTPHPLSPAARIRSQGHPRTAGPARCCRYGTPIDYTPIDLCVIVNSAARSRCDVPDNTTRPEHLSYTNPPAVHSHAVLHDPRPMYA